MSTSGDPEVADIASSLPPLSWSFPGPSVTRVGGTIGPARRTAQPLELGHVPRVNKILITREVGNTADEANAVAELMRTRGWKRIILVTTGWHMPRAAWLFRQVGVECTIFPVDFRRDRTRPITLLDFLPRADALWDTETALREISGNLFYRLFH